MNTRAYTVLGSLALSLVTTEAVAVKVTSTSVQTGRTEGQSVTVTATVDYETGTTVATPLERRGVTAAITNLNAVTSVPAVTKQISLSVDSSGKYVGQFPDLPIGTYSVTFTASRVITNLGFPTTTTVISGSATNSIAVGAPAGCFSFPNHSLQGFSANGFFDADTSQIVVQQVFNPQWSSLGFFGNNDGSFFLNMNGAQPPKPNQAPDFYRYDIISPDLSTNSAWQGITGLSFRYMSTGSATAASLHAVVRVRNPDGSIGFVTQADPATNIPVVSGALGGTFQTMVEHLQMPAGTTVVGTDVRVFVDSGAMPPGMVLDLVCPRH
jgi:hypothetical protein